MADCNDVLEGWDWENIFTSSLLEDDLSWHGELSEPDLEIGAATRVHPLGVSSSANPVNFTNSQASVKPSQERDEYDTPIASSAVIATNTSDGSLDSSGYNQDTPVSSHHLPSSETSLIKPPAANLAKKKKRDPRLECPNFLAGRIPCSCPEEDALEADIEVEALVKKRSKVGARCQVPSCGEDISHLKGYHQRHRVCLGCANSQKVMLKDQPHRYCQQCGKFHRLSDFDEGKRSCRRKLERHNRRRRRRAVEEGEGQDCEASLLEINIDCSNLHLSSEGAATPNAQSVAASTGQRQGMKTVLTKQKKEGKRLSSSDRTRKKVNNQNPITARSIAEDVSILPHEDNQRASDDSSGSVRRFEEDLISSDKTDPDDHCLLNVLMGSSNEHIEEGSKSIKHALKPEIPRTFHATTSQWKCTDYVSPCPTGRISFKLYDWNPADFPRRLRQQIFEWLANMPIELESYVRSGCIILTFFVTTPQLMWDKVVAEWKGKVQTFILESGVKLLGTSQLTTYGVDKSLLLKNGKATSASGKNWLAPFVVDLYPRSLEAGCRTQVYVFGFNFSGGRFLLSFGEEYIECSEWESVDSSHLTARKFGDSCDNIEVQKVTVFLRESEKFGLAYAEVESVHGLSNFMPMLVADKPICSEINTMRLNDALVSSFKICINPLDTEAKVLRSQSAMDMLTDLGWAFKYTNQFFPADKLEVREAFIRRVQNLLLFSLEHRCHAITQRLLQIALNIFVVESSNTLRISSQVTNSPMSCVTPNVYVRGLDVWNISDTSKDMQATSFSSMCHSLSGMSMKGHLNPRLATEAGGNRATHYSNKIKAQQGPNPAVEHLPLIQSSSQTEGSYKTKMNILPIEVPLLEERIFVTEDGWKHDTLPCFSSSWRRNPLGTRGTSILCTNKQKFTRILVAAVGVVTVCIGMCFMLQHPHEVAEISMSLRRCLWGSKDTRHV